MIEEWRPIMDGYYAVSNLGRVRRERPGPSTRVGRVMRPGMGRGGYSGVNLHAGCRGRHVFVHRLVALAFLGDPPPGTEVNHKNGDKSDCRASNLEYVTPSQNCKHAFRLGLNAPPTNRVNPMPGEKNGRAKLTEARVRDLRAKHAEGASIRSLTEEFGVCSSSVDYITRKVSWRHVK